MKKILVRGARTHNLKNIDIEIPRDQFVLITGRSGSGKSSLAFDTLYAEGQRRYVESLSTYARQFLSMMEKPDIDHIEGLSPAISIEQKSTSHNPRSTVGTVTEIYDYLRLLFARVGIPECPEHGIQLKSQTISQMVDQVLSLPEGKKLMLLAPVIKNRKGEHVKALNELRQKGFIRARINGEVVDLEDVTRLDKHKRHTIEVVVDRFKVRDDLQLRLAESFEAALQLSGGVAVITSLSGKNAADEIVFSSTYACPTCGYSLPELEPNFFSFNSPAGACSACNGLGVKQFFDEKRIVNNPELSLEEGAIKGWDSRSHYYFQLLTAVAEHYNFDLTVPFVDLPSDMQKIILYGSGEEDITIRYQTSRGDTYNKVQPFEGIIPNLERRLRETESNSVRDELAKNLSHQPCQSCNGARLNESARHVFVDQYSLPQITALTIEDAFEAFQQLSLEGSQKAIADKITKEITTRLSFLKDVGLNYLTLNRSADTLSGGEAQRIRLASQIGAGLVGVMYILDEPSIGLHQRDNDRLLGTLIKLRDMGNTVIVVEHDEEAIRCADHIIDIGPGAGVHGGQIIAEGKLDDIIDSDLSETGAFLSGRKQISIPEERVSPEGRDSLILQGASGNNLKSVDLEIPLGLMTCITGVSGSGKSTLINSTLYPAVATALNNASTLSAQHYKAIKGLDKLDKCINIDQSPIGRTPRSNPATYTGIFTHIRELFAGTQEARSCGYKAGRFSFNVKGGRCEACQGDGVTRVEMHFLADVYVTCDVCHGKRYNRETLEVLYKGKNIFDVLSMTIEEASTFFEAIPQIAKKLQTLMEVGLGYIQLGQSAMTLSGGEAQRVKLAKELAKRSTGKTLYILDEPTTGLHFSDIQLLLNVLQQLKEQGNSIVVIEHNLDVIKTADWIVDLGPEGGSGGGEIIATGAPEDIAEVSQSHTGQFLKKLLKK